MTEPHDPFAVPGQQPGQQPPPPPPPGYGPPTPGYAAPPPPGYGPPQGYPPGFGPPPYPAQKTNTLAIVALVSIFVCSPAALVLGIISRNQIKRTGEAGSGMALAGIIVGAISVAFALLFFVLLIVGASVSTSSGY